MATICKALLSDRIQLMSCNEAPVRRFYCLCFSAVGSFGCSLCLILYPSLSFVHVCIHCIIAASPFGSLEFVRKVYGSGLALRLATEQKQARDQNLMARAPGMESSNLLGEIVSGRDTTIDFGDYLSLPQHRPAMPPANPHLVMERRLGMHD
jgi:Proteasome maturation factor UMP1